MGYYPIKTLDELSIETVKRKNIGSGKVENLERILINVSGIPYVGPCYKKIKEVVFLKNSALIGEHPHFDVIYSAATKEGKEIVNLFGEELSGVTLEKYLKESKRELVQKYDIPKNSGMLPSLEEDYEFMRTHDPIGG